jgi:hypothetical protein
MPWWVYVQFESRYLRCDAVNQWHLVIEIVQGVRRDFEVDSPDEFSTASIGSVLVPGLGEGYLAAVEFRGLLDETSDIASANSNVEDWFSRMEMSYSLNRPVHLAFVPDPKWK